MINIDKLKIRYYSSYKLNKFREKYLSLCSAHEQTKIIFIFGCQRSGTTIIQEIISLSPLVKYHGEGEEPYFYDVDGENSFRFKSKNEINHYIDNEVYEFIVLKPLYESQNLEKLISAHNDSKAIWVFREYNDVINSHLTYYKYNAVEYIRPVFNSAIKSWINECIPENVIDLLKQISINEISDADAYAIFWLLRNSIYLDSCQNHNDNVLLVNYEDLITMPEQQTSRIFKFIGIPNKKFYSKIIRPGLVKKKYDFTINPIIKIECERVYNILRSYC